MMDSQNGVAQTTSAFDRALVDYFQRLDRGEQVEVETLVLAHPECETELRQFISEEQRLQLAWQWSEQPDATFKPKQAIDRFIIERQLGSGAFGTVWQATDSKLKRSVAIKLPRRGVLTGGERDRFLREARTVAQLKHPNIVQIHEVGIFNDSPYLVSDLIQGLSLAQQLATGRSYSAREAATLCVTLAEALHFAHQAGVVHRDLKPGNVLIDTSGQAHLTDFGLAKGDASEATLTLSGQVLGTPAYMSPEQATGDGHDADLRTDVYSLGVMLFELLTGELPFRGSVAMLIQQVATNPAPNPRKLNATIPRDLEVITLKCLEKEPSRRYQSAGSMRDDLRRFLVGEPILARRSSLNERLFLWANRNRRLTTVVLSSVLLLLVCLIGASFLIARANVQTASALAKSQRSELVAQRNAEAAIVSERNARDLLYAKDMALAGNAWSAGDMDQALALLNRHSDPLQLGGGASSYDPRGFEWHFLKRWIEPNSRILFQNDQALFTVAINPKDSEFVTAGYDSVIRWHDVSTGNVVRSLASDQKEINSFTYSPSGKLFATAGEDGTVKIWNLSDLSLVQTIQAHEGACYFVRFVEDDLRVISGGQGFIVRFWQIKTGNRIREFSCESLSRFQDRPGVSMDGIVSLKFNELIATYDQSGTSSEGICFWSLENGSLQRVFKTTEPMQAILDGSEEFVFVADFHGVKLLTRDTGKLIQAFNLKNRIDPIRLSPDGRYLVGGDANGQLLVWQITWDEQLDQPSMILTNRIPIHSGAIYSLAFASEKTVISVGRDGTARRTLISGSISLERRLAHLDKQNALQFLTPDTIIRARPLEIVDAISGEAIEQFSKESFDAIALSRNGKRIAAVSRAEIRVWDLSSGKPLCHLPLKSEFARQVAFLGDGSHLLLSSFQDGDSTLEVIEIATKRIEPFTYSDPVRWAFPCGKNDIVARESRHQQRIICWNLDDNSIRWQSEPFQEYPHIGAVSPDGKWLLGADRDRRTLTLYDCETGANIYRVPIDITDRVAAIAFTNDSGSFLIGDLSGRISLWHTKSGQPLFEIANITREVRSIIVARDRFMVSSIDTSKDASFVEWFQF